MSDTGIESVKFNRSVSSPSGGRAAAGGARLRTATQQRHRGAEPEVAARNRELQPRRRSSQPPRDQRVQPEYNRSVDQHDKKVVTNFNRRIRQARPTLSVRFTGSALGSSIFALGALRSRQAALEELAVGQLGVDTVLRHPGAINNTTGQEEVGYLEYRVRYTVLVLWQ